MEHDGAQSIPNSKTSCSVDGLASLAASLYVEFEHHLGIMRRQGNSLKANQEERSAIRKLDFAADKLGNAFARLHAQFKRQRNTLAPAVILPSEILGFIFGFGTLKGSFEAAAVCHRWRVAALSTVSLWTSYNLQDIDITPSLVRLLLSRSSMASFDIQLRTIQDNNESINPPIPSSLGPILRRARSLSNIVVNDKILRELRSAGVSSLEACHIRVTSTPFDALLSCQPLLTQISLTPNITTNETNTPTFYVLPREVTHNLRVLHLDRVRLEASSLHALLLELRRVEELAFTNSSAPRISVDPPRRVSPAHNPPMRTLSITDSNAKFAKLVLLNPGPIKVHPFTSVHIDLPKLDDNRIAQSDFVRNIEPGTTLWILKKGAHFVYKHQMSITQIVDTENQLDQRFSGTQRRNIRHMPAYVPHDSVETLYIPCSIRIDAHIMTLFTNLREIHFEFQTTASKKKDPGLAGILNSHLVTSCRHLEFIELQFVVPTLRDPHPDHAEKHLVHFLCEWIEEHKMRFQRIHVRDEVEYARWAHQLDEFRALTGEFEVWDMLTSRSVPEFPSLTRFGVN